MAQLVLIGLPIVLVLIVYGSFYAVFYFPNRTNATTGSIVSSGEKREYLLYVPKSYDRAKPTRSSSTCTLRETGPQCRGRLATQHICPSEQVFALLRVCHSGD